MDSSANNRRIAKNTIFLYIRSLVVIVIGLYTSRLVLNVLGINNYGIYNVVGGIVALLSIVTSSLSSAISRFLTVEMGKGDIQRLCKVFCTSVNIQLVMSLVIWALAELLGVWLLNNKLSIAPERMYAANWVFQFSIFSFIVNLVSVPYNAAIIAHERMKAFAYVSILEVSLTLAMTFCVYMSPFDKLISYAMLMLLVSFIIRFVYGFYCRRNFEECRYSFSFDRKLFKEMSKFAGWSFVASTLYTFNTQGVNIISNIFFGVRVNAARGIASQVDSKTRTLVNNFTTAVKPQIMKSYSTGNKNYTTSLICTGTKYSYFLMLFFAVPFFFEAEELLKLWLGQYPSLSPNFVKLAMCISLISTLGELLYTYVLAIGRLKTYVIMECIITCCVFPLSYIMFSHGYPPETAYILFALAYFILIFVRLLYLMRLEEFPVRKYLMEVLLIIIPTTIAALIFPAILTVYHINFGVIGQTIICMSSVAFAVYTIGMKRTEKITLHRNIIQAIYRIKH